MRTGTTCALIEVDFPEIDQEQLEPLIDLLAELLFKEHLQELEQLGGGNCDFFRTS